MARILEAWRASSRSSRLRGPALGGRRPPRLRRVARGVAGDVPILVVGTARPELLDRRQSWGAGSGDRDRARAAVNDADLGVDRELLAVSHPEAARSRLLGRPAATRSSRSSTCGWSPTWRSTRRPRNGAGAHRRAARRAARAREASRAGRVRDRAVFWSGVAAASGDDRWTVDERLRALERKALVRRSREASVAGETEWLRPCARPRAAYGAIPRATRAEKHRECRVDRVLGSDDHAERSRTTSRARSTSRSARASTSPRSSRALVALRQQGTGAHAPRVRCGRPPLPRRTRPHDPG